MKRDREDYEGNGKFRLWYPSPYDHEIPHYEGTKFLRLHYSNIFPNDPKIRPKEVIYDRLDLLKDKRSRHGLRIVQGAKVKIQFFMTLPEEIYDPKPMVIQAVGSPRPIIICGDSERWINCNSDRMFAVDTQVQFTSCGIHIFTAVPVPKSPGESFLDGGRSVQPTTISVVNPREFRWLGAPAQARLKQRFTFIHCWRVSADEGVLLWILPLELIVSIVEYI